MARAYLMGRGEATDVPLGVHAFLKSRTEIAIPDLHLLVMCASPKAAPWIPLLRPPTADGVVMRPVLLRPHSRGEIRLRSAAAHDPVRIQQNFLAEPEDVRTMRESFEVVRDIARQPSMQQLGLEEIRPGPGVQTDAEIDAYIRATSATAHHPAGTCKMGVDDLAVVDPQLSVRAVDGLRVVDASVMPDLVGGNINAPVMMIAERAADLIRGHDPLPASNA
jgi:choline dehydrogenase-like flavoprotein